MRTGCQPPFAACLQGQSPEKRGGGGEMPAEGKLSELSRMACASPCIPTTEAIPCQYRTAEMRHHVEAAEWVGGKSVATILWLENLERLDLC